MGNVGIGRGTTQCVHRALEFVIELPCTNGIQFFLDDPLFGDQFIHGVGIFHHLGIAKFFVDGFELFQKGNGFMHAFFHNFLDGLCRIELGFLFKKTDGVSEVGHDFALVFLINTCDNS